MEVLTLAGGRPPHEDVPMDLSTSGRRQLVLHHAPWPRPRNDHAHWPRLSDDHAPWPRHDHKHQVEPVTTLSPGSMVRSPPTTAARRYIPIPKKRHCHARASPPSSTNSHPTECQSPSTTMYSPPSAMGWDVSNSLSSEVACKRARIESPKPDLFSDSSFRLPSAENSVALPSTIISSSSSSSGSSGGGGGEPGEKWGRLGAELARGDGDALVGGGEGLSQSVMRPRQRQHSAGAGTSSVGSSTGLPLTDSDGVPGRHLINTLLHLHTSTLSQGLLPTAALKDTEALLTAVHQSQMLYYTYCSHLIQNLRAKHLEQEQQQQQQQQRRQEQTHLDYQSEVEKQIPLEDVKSYEYEDDAEEKLDLAEEEQLSGLNSILRARLNSQETPQLPLDQRSSSAGSPCGTLPSSTTGGEDLDLSPSESCGGARKRAPRALTGKHVRPGTGASASTLLTLRQKLKERQKYRELYGGDPPQPNKTNKARPRKR